MRRIMSREDYQKGRYRQSAQDGNPRVHHPDRMCFSPRHYSPAKFIIQRGVQGLTRYVGRGFRGAGSRFLWCYRKWLSKDAYGLK